MIFGVAVWDVRVTAGVPARAWQRLSAGPGAKGQRYYDWALITITNPDRKLADPTDPQCWWLLARRHRRGRDLPGRYERAYASHSSPGRHVLRDRRARARHDRGGNDRHARNPDGEPQHDVARLVQRVIAAKNAKLGPTGSVVYGTLVVPVYDTAAVARLHAHLGDYRSPRGRPRLWGDEERRARRAAHSAAGYRWRRAAALQERGDQAAADRLLGDAERIMMELRLAYGIRSAARLPSPGRPT